MIHIEICNLQSKMRERIDSRATMPSDCIPYETLAPELLGVPIEVFNCQQEKDVELDQKLEPCR